MTSPSDSAATARDAAERNAQAVMSGNLAQVMADITPEALTQMMQMAAQAGGMSPAAMPNIQSYDIAPAEQSGEGEVFDVTFRSPVGFATLRATWQQVMGQWKITAISLVSAEASQ